MHGGPSNQSYTNGAAYVLLTHCSLETPKSVIRAKSADPEHSAASDLGLHCLQIV